MKFVIVFCLILFAGLALARPGDDHYTDKYDNINLDEILSNRRLLEPYADCLLEKGKCTAEAKELRAHIKEGMENDCNKCTDTQKKNTRRVLAHLINNEHEYWDKLVAKYDPEKKYASKFEKELRV